MERQPPSLTTLNLPLEQLTEQGLINILTDLFDGQHGREDLRRAIKTFRPKGREQPRLTDLARHIRDTLKDRRTAERAVRPCVHCGQLVKRTKGCNLAICRCGATFCFLCGTTWSSRHSRCRTCTRCGRVNTFAQRKAGRQCC